MPKPPPPSPDMLPDDVAAWLQSEDIGSDGMGLLRGSAPFGLLMASPQLKLLGHFRERGPHPEVPIHQWIGILSIPHGNNYKAIVERMQIGDVLMVRTSWGEFYQRLGGVTEVAYQIEVGNRPSLALDKDLASQLQELRRVHEDMQNYASLLMAKVDQPYDEEKFKQTVRHSALSKEFFGRSREVCEQFEKLQLS